MDMMHFSHFRSYFRVRDSIGLLRAKKSPLPSFSSLPAISKMTQERTSSRLSLQWKPELTSKPVMDILSQLYLPMPLLGPRIIDDQIIQDADCRKCNWLNPVTEGCDIFDKSSGIVDANCGK
jgi:hypothetical protein